MFRLDQDSAVARLTLARPTARNAIPLDDWARLAALVGEVERSPARLLVVAGEGGAFCAGADLSDFPAMARDEAMRVRFRETMRLVFDRLAHLPMPVIGWIDGPCYGAGVALALACDLRVATATSRFAITPAKLGISFPQEDVHRLVALIGRGQAARLLFSAASVDAAEAARIGLVELVGADEGALIEAMLGNGRDSLTVLKRAIRLAAEGVRSDAEQDRQFDALIAGEEMQRRLAAIRGK
jgi:enoyl-CoA hydratase/carnithine racemase